MICREIAKEKNWFDAAPRTVSLRGIVARLHDAIMSQIPIGFQDQNGFHFGVKPPQKTPDWPPFW